MLIPKLLQCKSQLLFNIVKATKRPTNKPTTIMKTLNYLNEANIIAKPELIKETTYPSWLSFNSSIINDLSNHKKENTNANQYLQLFNATISPYKNEWKLIYTDGSKSDTHTTFAVTNDQGVTITIGSLPKYCSVLTAEAAALHEAVHFVALSGEKHIICTDSKSTISAILNQRNSTILIANIREMLYKYNNLIKVMWIPGHASIKGNEIADDRAKKAGNEPIHMFNFFTAKDIRSQVQSFLNSTLAREWSNYNHPYKNHNPTGTKPIYPTEGLSHEIKSFIRLRIGHTSRTHSHLLKGSEKLWCIPCNSNVTATHILDECINLRQNRSTIFGNMKPSNLLKTPSLDNIRAINKFLKLCNIRDI
uniref:RNase H type-1 domain-containing protein n=1 Tax=Ceratitis capitata TaxID=7213 RepID=W8C4N5_CERCA